jgi:nucleotide-binding universal stress UspA family protein
LEGSDVTLRQVIQHGHVGHATTELASVIGADLIEIGAKGHSQLDRILLGSTSDFVATQADCSVLVVRPTDKDPVCGQPLSITIGFDGSTGSVLICRAR